MRPKSQYIPGHGFLYNVLKGRLVKELGKVELKEEVEVRNRQEYIPNWFTADVRTGVSCDETILFIVSKSLYNYNLLMAEFSQQEYPAL